MNGPGPDHGPRPPLPTYLQKCLDQLSKDDGISLDVASSPCLQDIKSLPSRRHQWVALLLARHQLTQQLAECAGPAPELILQRAAIYEALGYSELALADAYVSYTLCEVALEGPDISDLEPVGTDGGSWPADDDATVAMVHKYRSLILLGRSALILGCQHQAKVWIDDMLELRRTLQTVEETASTVAAHEAHEAAVDDFCDLWTISTADTSLKNSVSELRTCPTLALFGQSQRLVYPWNEHEPDRMSREALDEINAKLHESAPDLEVKVSVLPNLMTTTTTTGSSEGSSDPPGSSSQLGLYATRDLTAGETILEERSVLTAIRPHGEALCDACAADVETIPLDERRYCPGCNIPFCSEACWSLAQRAYHAPNEEDVETDEGYPPPQTPFCPGTNGNEDIHVLGRAESSTTPEWDLYFLLLARTMQMAETQALHPLDLFEIKYLWGDFSLTTPTTTLDHLLLLPLPSRTAGPTLPYSVRHHVELPLQWFEILMHSRDQCTPYSRQWLDKYDWWIVQTLYAKARGVADAQQSTWTGKPEVAAVHPLWCLANHSCNPTVTWEPSGVRNLKVVKERVWQQQQQPPPSSSTINPIEHDSRVPSSSSWSGIKAGEEIWNHYTDINEKDVRERRARLRAVLGGDCTCQRCTAEASLLDHSHLTP